MNKQFEVADNEKRQLNIKAHSLEKRLEDAQKQLAEKDEKYQQELIELHNSLKEVKRKHTLAEAKLQG